MSGAIYRATCRKYMELRHIKSLEQLRQFTTVGSNKTFLKYWNDIELMPWGVMVQIMNGLKIPNDERQMMLNELSKK